MIPAPGRDSLSRLLTTRVRARSVSPWNTNLGKVTSIIPKLAMVVPSVVSWTDMPIMMPSVLSELNRRCPHSVPAAKCVSMCSGCGFIVRRRA